MKNRPVEHKAPYDVTTDGFTVPEAAFKYVAPYLEGRRVLDVGCYVGRHLESFSSASVGMDRLQPALGVAAARGLRVVRADADHGLPFRSAAFEGVFFAHLLEHIEAPVHLLRECHRVLREDGILVGCMPIEGTLFNLAVPYYGNDEHLYSFSLENMRVLLRKAGYEVERVYFQLFPGRLFRSGPFASLMDLAQHLPALLLDKIARNYWIVAKKSSL